MVKKHARWPILLLALDMLGAIIAAVGIIEYLDSGGVQAVLTVVAGLLLMLPLILHILKLLPARDKKTQKPDGEH